MAIRELNLADAIELGFFKNLPIVTSARLGGQPERRDETRFFLQVTAMATPLDAGHQPIEEPFPVLTRDISCTGIGFVHSRPLDIEFVQLELAGPDDQELQLMVEVLRCNRYLCCNGGDIQKIDDGCTFYQSGGRFVPASS